MNKITKELIKENWQSLVSSYDQVTGTKEYREYFNTFAKDQAAFA